VALAYPPSRARNLAIYTLQMFAYLVNYEIPADNIERVRRRTKIRYPILADRLIGLGRTPANRLQDTLRTPGEVNAYDMVFSTLHWLWYFVPHAAVVYVMVKRPDRLGHAAGVVAVTFDMGLVIYRAVPTAPPWWAAEHGYLPPLERVLLQTSPRVFGPAWEGLYSRLASNPYAAMPSLHFASSVSAARALREVSPRAAAVGWAYAGGLAIALVYLGEHYVVDLLAGLALAEGARGIVASPAFDALTRAARGAEP
jgi:membrane-associated phospholipid phosphatase